MLHELEQNLSIGRECPIPEGYAIDFSSADSNTWCTLTSNTNDIENAAGLMFHAPDTVSSSLPERTLNTVPKKKLICLTVLSFRCTKSALDIRDFRNTLFESI